MTTEAVGIAEMRGEMTGLNTRMLHLENRVDTGFARIEELISQEIDDLKQEQINDHKKQIDRLGDDQRRIWDHLHDNDKTAAGQKGGRDALFSAGHIVALMLGGLLTAIAAKLLGVPLHMGDLGVILNYIG